MNSDNDSTTRIKIFISAPYLQLEWDKYIQYFEEFEVIIPDVEERMDEEQLLEMFENNPDLVTGIVGDDQFTEKVYKQSNLKFLVKWGTGIDSLKENIATKYNIEIFNTPSAFTIPVSESVIGMMLSFCRTIKESDNALKKGSWEKIPGFTLNESVVGIIGLGNIGSEVAKKLEIFGSKIIYYDPNVTNFKYERCDNLHDLLRRSHIVTLHCDLNITSHHLIGLNELFLLNDKILINTARGPIIDNFALREYLLATGLVYLGLDVFEQEPLPNDSIFRMDSKRTIISAHNTNTSPRFWKNVHMNSIKMLKDNL